MPPRSLSNPLRRTVPPKRDLPGNHSTSEAQSPILRAFPTTMKANGKAGRRDRGCPDKHWRRSVFYNPNSAKLANVAPTAFARLRHASVNPDFENRNKRRFSAGISWIRCFMKLRFVKLRTYYFCAPRRVRSGTRTPSRNRRRLPRLWASGRTRRGRWGARCGRCWGCRA